MFIGSENDRVAKSRPRSKIHHVLSLYDREIFHQTLPTASHHRIGALEDLEIPLLDGALAIFNLTVKLKDRVYITGCLS